jgi:peroxiredoxin
VNGRDRLEAGDRRLEERRVNRRACGMRKRWLSTIAAVTLAVLCAAGPAFAVDVGDKAPEFAVREWAQGDPMKLEDCVGCRTLLVVFWRTFCDSMGEELSRLDKIYKDRRNKDFEIVAITTEPSDIVRPYLTGHQVEFRVGIDQFHSVQEAWLKKTDKQMPVAWLVDKKGVIVWKGDPWGCESVVDQVIAGKYDIEKSKADAARDDALWNAYEAEDWKKLAAESDKVLAADPNHSLAFDFRLRAFRETGDRAGYQKFMKAYVERGKDDAATLVRASNQLLAQPGETYHFRSFSGFFRMFGPSGAKDDWRDVDLSYAAAKRAVEVSKSADASALANYVRVLTTVGLLEDAIETQKKVVALDAKNEDPAKYLAFLQACLAARKKAK